MDNISSDKIEELNAADEEGFSHFDEDTSYREIAIEAAEKLEVLQEQYGEMAVRENTLLNKVEALQAAHEAKDAIIADHVEAHARKDDKIEALAKTAQDLQFKLAAARVGKHYPTVDEQFSTERPGHAQDVEA